jgi:hypothetical protein
MASGATINGYLAIIQERVNDIQLAPQETFGNALAMWGLGDAYVFFKGNFIDANQTPIDVGFQKGDVLLVVQPPVQGVPYVDFQSLLEATASLSNSPEELARVIAQGCVVGQDGYRPEFPPTWMDPEKTVIPSSADFTSTAPLTTNWFSDIVCSLYGKEALQGKRECDGDAWFMCNRWE